MAAASPVTTSLTELPDSRVRVEAEVTADELDRRLTETARGLAGQLRLPGFRRGKIPPPLVIRHLGREAVLDEVVRAWLYRWYLVAIDEAGVHPIGEPDVNIDEAHPDEGEPLRFNIEVGVRPPVTLGDYKGIEVGRREPQVDDAAVDAELEQLRERMARLETVERAAQQGDFVVLDFAGSVDGEPFAGGEARDQLVELGSGRLVPGFEDQIVGASAGEDRTVTVTFPDDYRATELAGKEAQFACTVKEVREKQLPELDDDFAVEAAGFDSLAELREDITTRLREAEERQITNEWREAVVDAVVATSDIELPDALVEARAQELWERMLHQLSHQGITKELYLQFSGASEEEMLQQAKPEADQVLRREAVIAAVVEAEGIEVADGDVLDALQAQAARENTSPEKLRARLERDRQLSALRDDLAHRRAVDLLVEQAKPVDVETARARKLIWTPDQAEKEAEGARAGGRLWVPETAAD